MCTNRYPLVQYTLADSGGYETLTLCHINNNNLIQAKKARSRGTLHSFPTSVPDGEEWLTSRSGHFIPTKVHIEQEAGFAPESVWTLCRTEEKKSLAPAQRQILVMLCMEIIGVYYGNHT